MKKEISALALSLALVSFIGCRQSQPEAPPQVEPQMEAPAQTQETTQSDPDAQNPAELEGR